MSAEIIPFPETGRSVRAIVVVPDGSGEGDACRSVLGGFPLDEEQDLSFEGPLWWVMMMLKDYRHGLPIRVHPLCEERARK
jgi:hypothetical protein